jgi:uncharacterized protein YjbI with pentapeptide repeats
MEGTRTCSRRRLVIAGVRLALCMRQICMLPKHTNPLPILVAAFFGMCSSPNANARQGPAKQRMTEQEFLSSFRSGHAIENRVIPAHAVVSALRLAQETAAGNVALHPQLKLIVRNSEIEGHLSNKRLHTTPVEQLPPELHEHYKIDRRAHVVPIHVEITDSVIRDGLDFGPPRAWSGERAFGGTMFLGHVNFSRTTFRGEAYFFSTVFRREANFAGARFRQPVYFNGSRFHERAAIANATFSSDADFTFQQNAVFGRTAFPAFGDFTGSSFQKAIFDGHARFVGAIFPSAGDFDGATFQGEADFSGATLRGTFRGTTFHSTANFSAAHVRRSVEFSSTAFLKDVFFNDINNTGQKDIAPEDGSLEFTYVNFSGRAYFDNTSLDTLWFSTKPIKHYSTWGAEPRLPMREGVSPVTFEKRAMFKKLRCANADFTEVEFREYSDFSEATFTKCVRFSETTFEADANFRATTFPAVTRGRSGGTAGAEDCNVFDGVRFQRTITLEWKQLTGCAKTMSEETWGLLEDAFKRSSNLEGQNQAYYQRRSKAMQKVRANYASVDGFEYAFWGYGVRPWRVGGWMLLVYLLFTSVYWTQTKSLAAKKTKWEGWSARLQFALRFAWLTSWKFGYGLEHARTRRFKIVTLVHSVGFKIMILCLLHVFANISPMLNSLMGKILSV